MPSGRRVIRPLVVAALVAGALSCGSPTEPTLVPKVLRIVGATADTGVVTQVLGQFTVELLADGNRPVPGRVVRFESLEAHLSNTSVTTDGDGRASVTVTLGTKSGDGRVGANAGGLTADLRIHTQPGSPSNMGLDGPTTQYGTVGTPLPAPLGVTVYDVYANPIPGAVVTWTRRAGSGTLDSTTTHADTAGHTRARYTLGPRAGTDTIRASIGTPPVNWFDFVAIAQPKPAAAIQVVAGAGQTVSAAALVAIAPSVKVLDSTGAPVVDAPVLFTPYRAIDTVTVTTGLDGVATVPSWRVSWRAGPDSIVATSGAVRVVIGATVTPGVAARLVATAPLSDSVQSGRTFPQPLRVAIADSFTNVVPGASANVTVAIALGVGTLEGTTTRATVGAAADFSDLVIHGGGWHLLRATAAGLLPWADSLVAVVAPTSLALAAPLAIVDVGGTLTPALEVRDSAGVAVQGAQIVVTSGDPTIVDAAPTGVLTGVARGSTIVSYASRIAADKRDSLLAVAAIPSAPIVISDLAGMTLRTDSVVDVTIYLDTRGGARAGSATIDVRWPPALLVYQSHELVAGGVDAVVNATGAAAGSIRLAFADPAGFEGHVPLLRIRFHASPTAAAGALVLGAPEISAADVSFTPLEPRATAVTHPVGVRP